MPHSLTPSVTASSDLSSALALDNIRQTLIRQEDTIIFLLIERAQFARNAAVYEADAVPVPDFDAAGKRFSLLEYLLRETEQIHGKIRRYTSPDEQAFYPDRIPQLVLPAIQYEQVACCLQQIVCLHRNIMSKVKGCLPAYCKTSNTYSRVDMHTQQQQSGCQDRSTLVNSVYDHRLAGALCSMCCTSTAVNTGVGTLR